VSSGLVHRASRGHLVHFLRHLLEMLVAMMVGMFAGGAIFTSALGITVEEAIQDHSVTFVAVMAFSMTAPMVAWMHYRGHHWDRSLEMAAAMIAPAIPLCALGLAGAIAGSICGLYCLFSVVAMVGVMVYRRNEYV
jgi:uncharacterized membrane protein YbjE (DUF340 family)